MSDDPANVAQMPLEEPEAHPQFQPAFSMKASRQAARDNLEARAKGMEGLIAEHQKLGWSGHANFEQRAKEAASESRRKATEIRD